MRIRNCGKLIVSKDGVHAADALDATTATSETMRCACVKPSRDQ